MRIHKNASKEVKEKLTQEWKDFQGKSKNSYKASMQAIGYSIIGMIILLIGMTLFSSCATTKVDKCCKNSDKIIKHYETK